MSLNRGEELRAKYGQPRNLGERAKNIFAFEHQTEEAAEAFVASNRSDGHPAWAEEFGDTWLSVVDIGPYLATLDAKWRASEDKLNA